MKIESTISPSKFRSKSINLNYHFKVGRWRLIFCIYVITYYTFHLGMNLRIVYLFSEYFFIYSNSAKLRKAKWSPSKIKEHNSHSRQWLGQCLGQKDRRDESVEVSVVQSLVMYVLHLILVFWVFFKRSDILVPRASELNPKCLQSFSVKRYVELKN